MIFSRPAFVVMLVNWAEFVKTPSPSHGSTSRLSESNLAASLWITSRTGSRTSLAS